MDIFEKLTSLGSNISVEKGKLSVFAILLREKSINKWDLIVSAPWVTANKREALKYLSNKIRSVFKPQELLSISRIVLIDQGDPALEAIIKIIEVGFNKNDVAKNNISNIELQQVHSCLQ